MLWKAATGKFSLLALAAILAGATTLMGAVPPDAQERPWTKDQILGMLKDAISPDLILEGVRERGIDFDLTSEVESELKHAGATEELLALLREVAPNRLAPANASRENLKNGLIYVWISSGTFVMGCSPGDKDCDSSETPPHTVTILKGFWLAKTPVTAAAYARFAQAEAKPMPSEPIFHGKPLNSGWSDQAMPIVNVTWDEACDYCAWAGGRLPSEAEWEYAARGGSPDSRYGPMEDIGWEANNSGRKRLDSAQLEHADEQHYAQLLSDNGAALHEVGQKRANALGLYDMLGDVLEWVSDWYDESDYRSSSASDPTGPHIGKLRVARGEAFDCEARDVRVSKRSAFPPLARDSRLGFRCVALGGPSQPPGSLGPDTAAPVPIYRPDPSYSDSARRAGIEGTVILAVILDERGIVSDCHLIKGLGYGLDEQAMETVRTWQFKPALRNGQPVAVRVEVEVKFRLSFRRP